MALLKAFLDVFLQPPWARAMLRVIRLGAWAAVVVLTTVLLLSLAGIRFPGQQPASLPLAASIGGPFELASTRGGTISSESLKGKPMAVFFGYTFCPDVCPTTLLDLSTAIKQLGADADTMNFVFISVDPARDTIEQLQLYLSSFDPHIVGATGTEVQIADVTRRYRAIYEKVASKDGYTINHTATTYLMDAQGRFHSTLSYQEKPENVVAKLRRLISGV